MILTHLPMTWSDHARHRVQPRWPLLLATNSRLRHLALAPINRFQVDPGYSRMVNSNRICNQAAKYLVPLSCKLWTLNTANSIQIRPNCLQNQKCWMKTYESIRSSCVFLQQLHTCYVLTLACNKAVSAVLPWNKHIFESLVWAKRDHMIYHLLGAIWPNKSRPGILAPLIWFILTYISMSSVHRFLMHVWIVCILSYLRPASPSVGWEGLSPFCLQKSIARTQVTVEAPPKCLVSQSKGYTD